LYPNENIYPLAVKTRECYSPAAICLIFGGSLKNSNIS